MHANASYGLPPLGFVTSGSCSGLWQTYAKCWEIRQLNVLVCRAYDSTWRDCRPRNLTSFVDRSMSEAPPVIEAETVASKGTATNTSLNIMAYGPDLQSSKQRRLEPISERCK